MIVVRILVIIILGASLLWYNIHRRPRSYYSSYATEMRFALRRVAAAQAEAREAKGRYARDLRDLPDLATDEWSQATVTIDRADNAGWRATAHHDLVTQTCWIEGTFQGSKNGVGTPECDREIKLTPVADSVRAGLAPRREFKQWLRAQ